MKYTMTRKITFKKFTEKLSLLSQFDYYYKFIFLIVKRKCDLDYDLTAYVGMLIGRKNPIQKIMN